MKKTVLNDDSDFSGYPVIDIDIKNESPLDWLDNNRSIIINESLTAVEKILYEDINEFVPVLKLTGTKISKFITDIEINNLKNTKQKPFILLGIDKSDINSVLEKSMNWCIDNEEYEICHRVKLLQEWISSNSIGGIE